MKISTACRVSAALLTIVSITVATAAAACAEPAFGNAGPASPGTAATEARANGDVVRAHSVVVRGLGMGLPVSAWQLHYKSTDGAGASVIDVATVVVPGMPWFGPGERPLISYQPALESLGPQCGPSAILAGGDVVSVDALTGELPALTAMLMRGWAVVLTDYEGPHGRFGDRRQTAHAVLDGVRAALRLPNTGLSQGSPLGVFGYSGGALATVWAAEEQQSYAPELNFAGVVAGGTPYRMLDVVASANGGRGSGLGVLVLLSMVRNYPQADFAALLNAQGKTVLAQEWNSCAVDLAARYAFRNLNDFTVRPDVWNDIALRRAADREEPGQKTLSAPLFDFHSVNDEAAPVAAADELVANYCAMGATVQRVRTDDASHILASLTMIPDYLGFFGDRFAGKPAPNSCARG